MLGRGPSGTSEVPAEPRGGPSGSPSQTPGQDQLHLASGFQAKTFAYKGVTFLGLVCMDVHDRVASVQGTPRRQRTSISDDGEYIIGEAVWLWRCKEA